MRIKYQEPWCLNPDIISYGMNSGNILTFDNSKTFTFYIEFELTTDKMDYVSNIVWKGNDELGIQIIGDQFEFTFRREDNQEDKTIGVLKYRMDVGEEKVFKILIDGDGFTNRIVVNGNECFTFNDNLIFWNTSTYNFGGGHSDNIEYDINFLIIAKKKFDNIEDINIDDNVLGYYDFEKRTEQKVWDKSPHFNLLNRFFL